jgi:hypothetical protein
MFRYDPRTTIRVPRLKDVLAFDDAAIARIMIAASRFERDAERTALLRKFAYIAERRPPPAIGGVSTSSNDTPPRLGDRSKTVSSSEELTRSPAAEKQRRYRERLRSGVEYVPLPVNRLILDYLVQRGLLPRDREAADRVEIGLAAAAALERAARADR